MDVIKPLCYICDRDFVIGLCIYIEVADLSIGRCESLNDFREYYHRIPLPMPSEVEREFNHNCQAVISISKMLLLKLERMIGIGDCVIYTREYEAIHKVLEDLQKTLDDDYGDMPFDAKKSSRRGGMRVEFIRVRDYLLNIVKRKSISPYLQKGVAHLNQADHLSTVSFKSLVGDAWPFTRL